MTEALEGIGIQIATMPPDDQAFDCLDDDSSTIVHRPSHLGPDGVRSALFSAR
jgi:hypothetical protein